jgi:hypothetical protein
MIHRDEYGIICQHDVKNELYLDGGDSANRTGIMALCGSAIDQLNVNLFFNSKGLVRHPHQTGWDDPTKTSRDQLVSYAAGVYASKNTSQAESLQRFYSGWRINKDILAPDVRGHLKRCAGMKTSFMENMFLVISIFWSTKVCPKAEQNQIISMVIVAGGSYLEMYKKYHPDIKKSLIDYWSGWRDQPDIYESIWRKLNE